MGRDWSKTIKDRRFKLGARGNQSQTQRNFDRLSNEVKEEKFKNAHSGIAGIVGGDPKYYGK